MYTVKQVAALANISVRTLHYYDEIDLLKPSDVGSNGYRYYNDDALMRLQQILLYREIGLELQQIKDVLDAPNFDTVTALLAHRDALQQKAMRMHELIQTVNETIRHLSGDINMSKKRMFKGFSDEQQKQYEREARLQWDPELVNDSVKRWGSYNKVKKEAIMEEGNAIYSAIVDAIEAGKSETSAEVQALMERWHDHIRYFYEPTLEILRGLGDLYNTHPDFNANFSEMHPELAGYMKVAIEHYVDALETAEITRMLAEDEHKRLQG